MTLLPARQLRIAMLSAHSCPMGKLGGKDTGGMSVWVHEVSDQLGKLGHSVDVFTRNKDRNDTSISRLGNNARLIHLPAGDEGEIDKLALYSYLPDFAGNVEEFRSINDLRYDIILSHYWLSGRAGQMLQRCWDTPHIIMFHTLGAVKNTLTVGEDEPDIRLETERELVQDCNYIIAATPQEKKALIKHYNARPENIRVIPCGVNPELFRPVDKLTARHRLGLNGDKVVVFVGRIEPLKGIDQLLKALPLLPISERIRLFIIGGDEYSHDEIERLRKLSRTLGVEKMVDFPGLVKQELLPYYYSAADVCVSPSYYESFGLVPLESLACGTPVLATKVGAAKSIIRHETAGYVVADNSPHLLADKMAALLTRPPADNDSVRTIRTSVNGFTWEKTAKSLVRVCRQALARRPALVSS